MPSAGNLFLASLSPADAEALRPHLRPVQLEHEAILFEAGGTIKDIYLPINAIVSLVVSLSSGETIETAMVGRDGMVGAAAALGAAIPVYRGVVQLAGKAMTCKVGELQNAMLKSQSLLSALFRHEMAVHAQASQSAACMAAHHVEARLCRWLLRARDLVDSDNLQFTHEIIAEMLGVERTSVTVHARALQNMGMIKYSRGRIQITDVEAMQDTVCECYGTVKGFYQTLLGSPA